MRIASLLSSAIARGVATGLPSRTGARSAIEFDFERTSGGYLVTAIK
jgi:hypothetical protein